VLVFEECLMKVVHEVLEVQMDYLLEKEVEEFLWKQEERHLEKFPREEEEEILKSLLIHMDFGLEIV
jgi:hypothetical protein